MQSNDMEMIKIKIDGKLYDVVSSINKYQCNKDAYLQNYTAVQSSDGQYALPVIKKHDEGAGVYVGGLFYRENLPQTEEEKQMYSIENAINLSDSSNISELLKKQTAIRDIEEEILTNADNIYTPRIGENDTAAAKALKEAVIMKNIDLNKYEPRFGANYNNDKRILSKNRVSLSMMERVCNVLDIKATLILEDRDPNVPNPMGSPIRVEITNTETTETEEDNEDL